MPVRVSAGVRAAMMAGVRWQETLATSLALKTIQALVEVMKNCTNAVT